MLEQETEGRAEPPALEIEKTIQQNQEAAEIDPDSEENQDDIRRRVREKIKKFEHEKATLSNNQQDERAMIKEQVRAKIKAYEKGQLSVQNPPLLKTTTIQADDSSDVDALKEQVKARMKAIKYRLDPS